MYVIQLREYLMTKEEIEKEIQHLKEFTEKCKKNPEEARQFLLSTGIYTKSGKLKKAYRYD